MHICTKCGNGKHHECNTHLVVIKKKSFGRTEEKETTILCRCPCHEINDGDINQFKGKFGNDIRETNY